jgi:hypothetical protein
MTRPPASSMALTSSSRSVPPFEVIGLERSAPANSSRCRADDPRRRGERGASGSEGNAAARVDTK